MKTDYAFALILGGMLFFLGFLLGVLADAGFWSR